MNKRFTLIELLTCIAIIAILISMLLPSLSRVKERARRVQCTSNLNQLMIAYTTYASQNKGVFPMENRNMWSNLFAPHRLRGDMRAELDLPDELYQCPSRPRFVTQWEDAHGSRFGDIVGTPYSDPSMRKPTYSVSYLYLANAFRTPTTSHDPHYAKRPTMLRKSNPNAVMFADTVFYYAPYSTWTINHPVSSGGQSLSGGDRIPNMIDGSTHAYVDGHTEWRTEFPTTLDTTSGGNVSAHHTSNNAWGSWFWVQD